MYLVIELVGEDYPMLIKLSNQPQISITSLMRPLVEASFKDEKITLLFCTRHCEPVSTIDGVRAEVFHCDNYGQQYCKLVINANRLKCYRLEMLDDESSYIKCSRLHFAQKIWCILRIVRN